MPPASLDSPLRPAPDAAPRSGSALTHAAVGSSLVVVGVDEPHAPELAREGLLPGSLVRVSSRVPLGGPLIVELGRVRLAIGSSSAAAIRVVPSAEPSGQPATQRAAQSATDPATRAHA